MPFLYLFIAFVPVLFGFWYICLFSYWTKRGIRGPVAWPVFGHVWEQYWKGQHKMETEWLQKYGKVYGTYDGSAPILSIADSELIKQVTIKDFHLFINRNKVEGHLRQLIFFMEGENWKRVRAIVRTSPAFTSGKLKSMKALMNVNVDKLSHYFEKITENAGEASFDTKKVIYGFTIDVISSTFFGTETNANGDRDKEHPLVTNGIRIFENQGSLTNMLVGKLVPKWLLQILQSIFGSTDGGGGNYIGQMLASIIAHRRATSLKRNDFVQLLIDASVSENELNSSGYEHLAASMDIDDEKANAQKHQFGKPQVKIAKQLSDPEINAQMMIFFIGGFETTATTITHCLFELAANGDIQDRLCLELDQALLDLERNGDSFYETVMTKIAYLDAVIKETLRKYPPLTRVERRVGQNNYQLGGVTLAKDQMVQMSVYAVHHNPEYYPEPDRFNPDRFMPENKHLLVPYTYLPFGQGPRNCIGMRFAYQEIKLCLAKIVLKFKFSLPPGAPAKLDFQRFNIASALPFQLCVARR